MSIIPAIVSWVLLLAQLLVGSGSATGAPQHELSQAARPSAFSLPILGDFVLPKLGDLPPPQKAEPGTSRSGLAATKEPAAKKPEPATQGNKPEPPATVPPPPPAKPDKSAPVEMPEGGDCRDVVDVTKIRAGKTEAVLSWYELICDTFPSQEWSTAFCVMSYESGGSPSVKHREKNGNLSVGLFQINSDNLGGANRIRGLQRWPDLYNNGRNYSMSYAQQVLLDPEWNVRAAYDIWASDGWRSPWRAQKHRCGL